jgi:hypothetical protein
MVHRHYAFEFFPQINKMEGEKSVKSCILGGEAQYFESPQLKPVAKYSILL